MSTSSPGSSVAISASINPCLTPIVAMISRSGSATIPLSRSSFSAHARRYAAVPRDIV